MKANQLHSKKQTGRNHILGLYILGITTFSIVYTTLTLITYL